MKDNTGLEVIESYDQLTKKQKKYYDSIIEIANTVKKMTYDEIKTLPGILGKSAYMSVKYSGIYGYHNDTEGTVAIILK